jgi:hypothetical protein
MRAVGHRIVVQLTWQRTPSPAVQLLLTCLDLAEWIKLVGIFGVFTTNMMYFRLFGHLEDVGYFKYSGILGHFGQIGTVQPFH